ncbi:MAG: SCO family protein [Chlorobiaceae bacterium]|nr:SCO family protein [Chlorobiaceae bacterium]MBA4308998.1 SCO family protein [Chlorobiaceae bacterium]
MKNLSKIIYLFFLILIPFNAYSSEPKRVEIGIDEHLGDMVPMNLKFIDEKGNTVELKDIITKPTLLMFVYFECPSICSPLLSEVAQEISRINLKPGIDYQVVSISIDSDENFLLAADKKKNYIKSLKDETFPEDAWRFLTGDSANIYSLTNSTGFMFKKVDDEFIHAGALIFLSPQGKITRYLLGTSFLPFDIKMALIEAQAGRTSPTVAKFLKFCFNYDPEGRKYVLNVTQIAGTLILLATVGFVLFLVIKPKKKDSKGKKV